MTALRVVVVVLSLAAGVVAQQAPHGIADKISLLTAPKTSGCIDRDRLAYALWMLAREQNLERAELPRIVVIQISDEAAARFGSLSVSPILVDHLHHVPYSYFVVWMVGEPKPADYVMKLQAVLQHEFQLQQTAAETQALVSRVAALAWTPHPQAHRKEVVNDGEGGRQ